MPPPFQDLTLDEFANLLAAVRLRRRITSVHLHHTWRPSHVDYVGHDTIVAMWRYHTTATEGKEAWADLAQHITIAPDGVIWMGRSWERPPASATGHNGTSAAGPLMIEMVGNFDVGADRFEGDQRSATLDVLARLVDRFGLTAEDIRFHSAMSAKTCPGTSIDRTALLAEVDERRAALADDPARVTASSIFPPQADVIFDVIERFNGEAGLHHSPAGESRAASRRMPSRRPPASPVRSPVPAGDPDVQHAVVAGARKALCVGIDRYRQKPLQGCIADARLWGSTLRALGFKVDLLLDDKATRAGILKHLEMLIRQCDPGDVVVLQFSGHGTTLPDRNGDEAGGETPREDEAICPFDYATGAFVVDDDLAAVYAGIPPGVSVTQFIDCCHSGTISRFGVGRSGRHGGRGAARVLEPTRAMIGAHLAYRGRLPAHAVDRGPGAMREVLFSACRSSELAWETDGQGDFTRIATDILAQDAALSNQTFLRRVTAAFGPSPRQHPRLDCAPASRHAPLFGAGAVVTTPADAASHRGASRSKPDEETHSRVPAPLS